MDANFVESRTFPGGTDAAGIRAPLGGREGFFGSDRTTERQHQIFGWEPTKLASVKRRGRVRA